MSALTAEGDSDSWVQQKGNVARIFTQFLEQDNETDCFHWERLGEEIANALLEGVEARGAACMLEAEHLCVFARGNPRSSVTRTLALAGEFAEEPMWHDRCLAWLNAGGSTATKPEGEPK